MTTILMQAPATIGGQIFGSVSGQTYGVPANGLINANPVDVPALQGMGFTVAAAQNADAAGLTPVQLSLYEARTSAGIPLAAAAAAGVFGLTHVSGTQTVLTGEAAQGNTKTDTAALFVQVPNGYIAGQPLTVTVNAKLSGTGTAGTKTIGVQAYVVGNNGQHVTLTVAPASDPVTTTATDYAFAVSGAALAPNAQLALLLTSTLQETGGTASLTMQVNGVRMS